GIEGPSLSYRSCRHFNSGSAETTARTQCASRRQPSFCVLDRQLVPEVRTRTRTLVVPGEVLHRERNYRGGWLRCAGDSTQPMVGNLGCSGSQGPADWPDFGARGTYFSRTGAYP